MPHMSPEPKGKLVKKAYAFLSRMLLRGEFPPGSKLSERALSEKCGVSRVPMREAIRLLIEEGALTQRSQSGTYVNALSRDDLIDIYEIREAIECQQVRAAIPRMTPRDRETLLHHVRSQHEIAEKFRASRQPRLVGKDESDFLSHDFAQHLLILRRAGNRFAEKIVTSAYRRNSFFGLHSHVRDLKHIAWTWRYHKRLVEAIVSGDPERAEFWMRQHIIRSKRDAIRQFDEKQAEEAAPSRAREPAAPESGRRNGCARDEARGAAVV